MNQRTLDERRWARSSTPWRWTHRVATRTSAAVLLLAGSVCFATEPEIYVKYSKFITLVERGKVVSLSIDDSGKIEGVQRGTRGNLVFWTHWPARPADDTLLRRLLRGHPSAVEFRAPVDPEQYLWMSLAAFLIDSILFPVVTLVLLFRVFRRLKSLERRIPGVNRDSG